MQSPQDNFSIALTWMVIGAAVLLTVTFLSGHGITVGRLS
jgi:hypothetical protein